jgi:hypothetical protein
MIPPARDDRAERLRGAGGGNHPPIGRDLINGCLLPILEGMTETDTGMEEKPTAHEAHANLIRVEDLPALIREVYAKLREVGWNTERAVIVKAGDRKRGEGAADVFVVPGYATEAEAGELTEIYDRIDRELAVEEARADRLLRLYNL